jgi:hypothetical protein
VIRLGQRQFVRVIANGVQLDIQYKTGVDVLVDAAPDDTWLTVVHVQA